MSRFYSIVVGPETATPIGSGTPSSGPGSSGVNTGTGASASGPSSSGGPSNNAGATWTNLVGGQADLGAQTVEWDIWANVFDAPVSPASIKIWGVSKQQISQASDFNGATIKVYGGMQPGLPLASAAVNGGQAGLLLSGQIFQAFGNWQGINQTLDFVVTSDGGATQSEPVNLSFLWLKGQPLSQVIGQTLKIAYPALQINVNINGNLVLNQTEAGVYQTLQQFATYIKGISQDIIGGDYLGVSITLADGVINVFDGSNDIYVTGPKQIEIQDLIGQPTWLSSAQISFSTVMRADLALGSQIALPQIAGYQAVTTPGSGSNARIQNTFNGTWTVQSARHVGNSRAQDAQSWISVFQAIPNITSASQVPALAVADSSA